MALINNLLNKIEGIAKEQNAQKVIGVKVKLGALSHISADHFRGHFNDGVAGTIARDARLEIEMSDDQTAPDAQDIVLQSIEVEDG